MSNPLGQRGLHAVVVGTGIVRILVDKPQVWEAGTGAVWTEGRTSNSVLAAGRVGRALIEVAKTSQSGAVIAHIAKLQGEVGGESARDTEIPIGDVRVLEIRVHRQDCAWSGRGARDRATRKSTGA